MAPTLQQRFDNKYMPEPNSGCWIWLGAVWKCRGGARGNIIVNGRPRFAYRVSYELHIGPVPDGLLVCHSCDTPICVNPDYLFVGTHADNMLDMVRKGRWRAGHCKSGPRKAASPYHRGETNPHAKLTAEQVRAIRASTSASTALASMYGVTRSTITHIRDGSTWRSLA